MGCRCAERAAAAKRTVSAVARGDLKTASEQFGFITQTFREDARSGDLRKAAAVRLPLLRRGVKR